ncbi:MAG: hypothetical protein AB7S37_01420 [Methanobacteriales archaeon]
MSPFVNTPPLIEGASWFNDETRPSPRARIRVVPNINTLIYPPVLQDAKAMDEIPHPNLLLGGKHNKTVTEE